MSDAGSWLRRAILTDIARKDDRKMTARKQAEFLNLPGKIFTGVGSITIPIRVRDVRMNYGRTQLLVCPEAGEGEAWVDINRITLEGRG